MLDQYLNWEHQFFRLKREYEEHGSLIIAVDFDETIYDFHKKGNAYPKTIQLLKRCNTAGFKLVIFTANKDHSLITEYCNDIGIEIAGINVNILPQFEGCGKIYYNILLDDRAGLDSAYKILNNLLWLIEGPHNEDDFFDFKKEI